ncbi:hypothetical protein BDR03DRAFT_286809 [Suillus americanus]|nr:hypothetical protein BDR03DRAFT_286809 [Suillus americanus]
MSFSYVQSQLQVVPMIGPTMIIGLFSFIGMLGVIIVPAVCSIGSCHGGLPLFRLCFCWCFKQYKLGQEV